MPSPKRSPRLAPPRFATPRPVGPTYGPAICKVMAMSGTPAMPWQEHAADVIGAIDPATGLRMYSLIIISVPRQSGKTRLMGGAATQRALQSRKAAVWSTAQTGQHARRNWLKFSDDVVDAKFPLASLFKRLKSRGDEQLLIPRLGSFWSPHPPTEDSLHGEQGDLNFIDEAWVFDEAEGKALMQAITPTHATRPGAQTVIISTRGTAASTWFHDYIGRAASGEPGIALLDWGIPDDVDASDIAAVAAFHPAVGFTQTLSSLESAWAEMGGAVTEFARAYGNRASGSRERLIPIEAWEMAKSTEDIPPDTEVAFGAAVSIDRTQSAIVACGLINGIPHAEAIEIRPGTQWAADRIRQLQQRHGGTVVIDAIGPAGTLAAELERDAAVQVTLIRGSDLTAACADVFDRLTQVDEYGMHAPTLRVRPDGAFDTAMEVLAQRRVGDAWVWDRRSPAGSIAPIEALTLAVHGAFASRPTIAPLIC